jgi:arylsulfatase A-like enzyme/Flp pilus assembly protein TadD
VTRRKRNEPTSAAAPPGRRRSVFLLAGAVCALAGRAVLLFGRGRSREAAGASVLLVTIDTLRADHVGAYGAKTGATPHLDALAARGTVFEEALASVPLTLPSHASLLSGREPPHHGVHLNGRSIFPADAPTLATLLKGRGYATAAFVAAYVLDRRFGLARGFDLYDDQVERRGAGGSVLESERPCLAVAAAAEQWIGGQKEPFFAWVHFYEPHAPYDPPSPYREQQGGRPYDGEIAAADACVGRVVAAAEARASGRLLVAATSDHGEALGDHGELTHGFFVYQPTLRVPLILAGAGIPVSRRTAPARAVDLVPTVLARLGVSAPAGLDGADLFGPGRGAEAYAETRYPETLGWAGLRALRVGGLKYIDAPRPELYDLGADPGETRNLFPTRAADAQRLLRGLDALKATERAAVSTANDPEIAEKLRALGYVAAPAETTSGPRLDPKDALPSWRLFEEAIWADARGDHAAAVEGLRPLVRREPGNPAFRQALAAALRAAGRPAEAAAALGALDTIAPSDPVAWHERSIALDAAGQMEEAMRSERRAIALDPALPEPHNHLGSLLARGGRSEEALAEFTRATTLDPNNAAAWTNRANALRARGQPRDAAEAYRMAGRLAPRDPGARNGLGVLAVESGELDRAIALFEEALAIDPRYHEARLNLAVAQVRRGNAAAARAALQALLQAKPDRETAAKATAFLRDLGGS